jgi:hypothetical protein
MSTGSDATTISTTALKNTLYTATGSAGSFTSDSPIQLDYRQSYQICAYAPYQSVVSDPTAVVFSHGTDILYASPINATITGSTATVVLPFVHKVSQIQFHLVSGSGSPDMTGATMKVSGFKSSCTLNLTDGSLTPVSGSGVTITDQNKSVCFIPDSQPMTLSATVTTRDGKSYSGTITRSFMASNSYSYTLTVNSDHSELAVNSQIIDWIAVSGGSINIWTH